MSDFIQPARLRIIRPPQPDDCPLCAAGYVPVKRHFVNIQMDGKPYVLSVSESLYKQLTIVAAIQTAKLPWYRRFWRRLTNLVQTIRSSMRVYFGTTRRADSCDHKGP